MVLSRSSLLTVSILAVIIPTLLAASLAYQWSQRPSEMLRAAREGNLATIKRLIAVGTDPKVSDDWDTTPLMVAAGWGHVKVVATLIDAGVPINERSRFGRTPLMWAAMCGQEPTVRYLLEAGADKELLDRDGKSAVDLAKLENHPNVVELIQSFAVDDHKNELKRN